MPYTVTIVETFETPNGCGPADPVKRYEQTVDALDMRLVMRAVNTKPRAPRVRKQREEANQ